MTNQQRELLVQWLGEDRYIIEDSSENDYCYCRRKKTLWELSGGKNVIYWGSFSGTIAPSMKIGYILLPKDLSELWQKNRPYYSNRVSRIEQNTLAKFIDSGLYEQHVGYMRSIYREKMSALVKAVSSSPLASHTTLTGTDAGMFCLAEFDINAEEHTGKQMLLHGGVKASPLSSSIGKGELSNYPPNTYVIGFGDLKISQIHERIEKWAQAWKKFL